jgi:hypothetical protein
MAECIALSLFDDNSAAVVEVRDSDTDSAYFSNLGSYA